MEAIGVLNRQETWVYNNQARRIQPGKNSIVDQKSLFALFSRTIDQTKVGMPFKVVTEVVDSLGNDKHTGGMLPLPYLFYSKYKDNPEWAEMFSCYKSGPQWGTMIWISNEYISHPEQEELDIVNSCSRYNPRILLANLVFYHEMGPSYPNF